MGNTSSTSVSAARPARIDPNTLEFESLSAECQRGFFACGYSVIEGWFQHKALSYHEKYACRVTTAHLEGIEHPVGFYAMSLRAEAQADFASPDPVMFATGGKVPVLHLDWFAVATDHQRRGIGRLLMGRALEDCYEVIRRVGAYAVTLKAISKESEAFYRELGFSRFGPETTPQQMLMPAQTVVDIAAS